MLENEHQEAQSIDAASAATLDTTGDRGSTVDSSIDIVTGTMESGDLAETIVVTEQVHTAQIVTEQLVAEKLETAEVVTEQVDKAPVDMTQVVTEQVVPFATKPARPTVVGFSIESAIAKDAEAATVKKTVAEPANNPDGEVTFRDLALSKQVQQAIESSGYKTPTPVQAKIIPLMLEGRDVLAQSQTGTGKTAAFALPILTQIDLSQRSPQVLVLAPTRELAIQVANSISTYGKQLDGLGVATIYGGQSYDPQLRQLRRGVQIVVGTPGRVIDHINRGTLDISRISCLVLDEADEMLNMGFLEDVQFVLDQAPDQRQIALFSATLPGPIKSIAERYLNNPARITVKKKTMTADLIRQRALFVAPRDKVYALCRILEAEETDGVIVFTKTKAATLSVTESLAREGLSAVALNGDMPQATRERTIDQFRSGRLDVLVATDVAARGLDVKRVSHVFNFDLPHDAESYIHRVGRTGRAGRKGEAIIFLSNGQRGKLRLIERATKQPIDVIGLPTTDDINQLRIKRFKQRITEVTAAEDLTMFKDLIAQYASEAGKPVEIVAAALAHISQQGRPFLAKDRPKRERKDKRDDRRRDRFEDDRSDHSGGRRGHDEHRKPRHLGPPEPGMERYRIEVGHRDGVKPGNIVGAVANEAGIDGEFIGPIRIHDAYSTVDLPEGMPKSIYQSLRRTWVSGKQLQLSRASESDSDFHGAKDGRSKDRRHSKPRGKHGGGGKHGEGGNRASFGKSQRPGKSHPNGKRKKRKSPSA